MTDKYDEYIKMYKPNTREQDIEAILIREVERVGGMCLKLSPDGAEGIPDRLVVLPEHGAIFVELKAERGRLSEAQKYQQKRLKDLHMLVVNVWSAGKASRLVDELLHPTEY